MRVVYKTVLIDLDDTLLVEERSAYLSFMAVAEYLGSYHDIIPEEFVATVRAAARELWYSLPAHGYAKSIGIASHEALWAEFSGDTAEQRELLKQRDFYQKHAWLNALGKYNINDEDLAVRLSSLFREERRKRHVLFDDAVMFLDRLREMKVAMALISNGTPDLQREKIRGSGVGHFFRCIAISGEIGHRKPRGEIFMHCLRSLGSSAGQSIMIGDRLDTDIQGANDMGITSVWLNRDCRRNLSGIVPDFEIHGLTEAIPLVCEAGG